MGIFEKLFRRKAAAPEQKPVVELPKEPKGPDLSQWDTFGRHRYYSPGDEVEVIFTNGQKGIRRVIVDDFGVIRDFPGIEDPDRVRALLDNGSMEPKIRFRTDFCRKEDGIHMLWQIQPDGRYWADDDGFGMENDCEVILKSVLDDEGRFTMPFRLYEVNGRKVD